MSILDYFATDMTTATIKRPVKTVTDGVVSTATSTIGSVSALYWQGSAAQAFVSERFKDKTDAAISVGPGTDIARGDRITVGGMEYNALQPVAAPYEGDDGHILVALEVYS